MSSGLRRCGVIPRHMEVVGPMKDASLLGTKREYWHGDKVVPFILFGVHLSGLRNFVIYLGNIFLACKCNLFEYNPKFICLCDELLKKSVGPGPNMREVSVERMRKRQKCPLPPSLCLFYTGGEMGGFHYFSWWGLYLQKSLLGLQMGPKHYLTSP